MKESGLHIYCKLNYEIKYFWVKILLVLVKLTDFGLRIYIFFFLNLSIEIYKSVQFQSLPIVLTWMMECHMPFRS